MGEARVQTIDQYFILKEIEKHFVMSCINVTLDDKNKVTVTDEVGEESISFVRNEDGKIILD